MSEEIAKAAKGKKREILFSLIENGTISEKSGVKRKRDGLTFFEYRNRRRFEYCLCQRCGTVMTSKSGGHQMRHLYAQCENVGENRVDKVTLAEAVFQFFITTGVSVHSSEYDALEKLTIDVTRLGGANLDPDEIRSCRQTVTESGKAHYADSIRIIGDRIKPSVESGEFTLIIDVGIPKRCKHVSCFISFIENGPEKNSLQLLPIGFCDSCGETDAEDFQMFLSESASKFGIDQSLFLKGGRIVVDGAENVQELEENFDNLISCGRSLFQKLAERIFTNLAKQKSDLEPNEMVELGICYILLELCVKLANLVDKHSEKLNLENELSFVYLFDEPSDFVANLKFAKEMRSILPKLAECDVAEVKQVAGEINSRMERLNTTILYLEYFIKPVEQFEKNQSNVMLIAPHLIKLRKILADHDSELDFTLNCLKKSGYSEVCDLERNLPIVYYAAAMLTPQMKKMQFTTIEKYNEAHVFIKKCLLPLVDETVDQKPVLNDENNLNNQKLFEFMDDPSIHDELEIYTSEFVSSEIRSQSVIDYWLSARERFPNLSKVALQIFSNASNETICVQSFHNLEKIIGRNHFDEKGPIPNMEEVLISYFYEKNIEKKD